MPVSRREGVSLALVVMAGLAVTVFLQNRPRSARELTLTPVVRSVLEDQGSPRIGSSNPDVIIIVFTDYQCPICKLTDPALERLIARDPMVQVVFKDWPIFGEESKSAARAALAADRQGKYLTFHAALMAARVKLAPEQIQRIAGNAGLDWPRLEGDEAALRLAFDKQLGAHAMQAWSLGLEGTPSYLIGPYLYEGGLDDRHMAQAVARARRRGPIS